MQYPSMAKEAKQATGEHRIMTGAACIILTTENTEGPFCARLARDENGCFSRIVEAKDGAREVIKEMLAGASVFDSRELFRLLPEIRMINAQREHCCPTCRR